MFYEWQWWNIDKNNLRMYFELIGGGTANRQKSELTHAQYLIYILLGLKFTKFLEFLFLLISLLHIYWGNKLQMQKLIPAGLEVV